MYMFLCKKNQENEKWGVGLVEEKGKKGRKISDVIMRSDSNKKITLFKKRIRTIIRIKMKITSHNWH